MPLGLGQERRCGFLAWFGVPIPARRDRGCTPPGGGRRARRIVKSSRWFLWKEVKRTYLWWWLSGMQPRTSLCHMAKLQAISALWHPSAGSFGSRSQSWLKHSPASIIGASGNWGQCHMVAWLSPPDRSTLPKRWPWSCRWLRSRIVGALEDCCISSPIGLRPNAPSKHVCAIVSMDTSPECPFDRRSSGHQKSVTRRSGFRGENFGLLSRGAIKGKWREGWRLYT